MFHIHVDHTTHRRVLLAAIDLLQDLLQESAPAQRIAPADRPDVGISPPPSPVPPPTPMSWPQSPAQDLMPPNQPWGSAAAPLPLPHFAPSTAGAPTWGIAPVALMGSSAQPGLAASSPAPNVAPAVLAPTGAATVSLAGIALDTKGLPWDGRIHSGGKSKLDNGTWKLKKGVSNDLAFVSRIEAELRQVVSTQIPPAPTQAPQFVLPPAPTPVQQQQQQQSAPTPLPQVQWQQPQAPQNISGPQTFADFNAAVSAATSTGQISVTRLLEVVTELGLPSVPMLQHRPELVPIAWAKLTGQAA